MTAATAIGFFFYNVMAFVTLGSLFMASVSIRRNEYLSTAGWLVSTTIFGTLGCYGWAPIIVASVEATL